MKFEKTPFALAAIALCSVLPLGAQAAPTVSFKAPTSGKTVSGVINQSSACEVTGTAIAKVQFFLDGTTLNTEGSAAWQCNLDTRKFSNGTHTLKAVAYDSAGASRTAQVSVNIQNGSTTPAPTPTPSPYGVYFKTPAANATLSGAISASSACEVAGTGIAKVQFYLDSTPLNTEGSAPWQCTIAPAKFTTGTHTLKAVATYKDGKTGTAQIAVNIKGTPAPVPNTLPAPAPTPATSACANPSGGYEGFGRNTTGGAGKPVYRVTNLNDSGAGSLRDALSQGNRCVVFDVGGTISLSGNLLLRGANVTIDGLTAPSPGITLRNRTLVMQGSSGAGNVVLRGIRARGTPTGEDAIRVYNASNIVIDQVSVSGFGDGAIDITEKSHDVTIQWSILGDGNPSHNFSSLIKYDTTRVTIHHNLYVNSTLRNPHCGRADGATSALPEIVCDVRNNLIWNYQTGTEVRTYATGNVVNNYYFTPSGSSAGKTIFISEGGVAHVSGNHSQNGWNVNANGNRSTPYAAVVPTTTDAITAAHQVVAKAGARGPRFGLDAADQGYIGQISLTP